MNMWRHLDGPHARPFAVLAACIMLLAAVDGGQRTFSQRGDRLQHAADLCDHQSCDARARPDHDDPRVRPVGRRHVRHGRLHRGADRHASSLAWTSARAGHRSDRRHRAGLHHRASAPVVGRRDARRPTGLCRHRLRADREPLAAVRQSGRRAPAQRAVRRHLLDSQCRRAGDPPSPAPQRSSRGPGSAATSSPSAATAARR